MSHTLNDPTRKKPQRWQDRSAWPFLIGLFIVMILAGGLASCGSKGVEQFKDAPVGDRNTSKADLITYPDGFSNVAAKCDGPNRVYVIFKADATYGSLAVAPNDPRCK